jgi:hypothetical protein
MIKTVVYSSDGEQDPVPARGMNRQPMILAERMSRTRAMEEKCTIPVSVPC